MAEILVKTRDQPHRDQFKDMWRYKRGDVVVIKPDGSAWGRRQCKQVWVQEGRNPGHWPGTFLLIRVKGVEPSALEYLREFGELFGSARQVRRKRTIDLHSIESNLSLDRLNHLYNTGYIDLTPEQLNTHVRDYSGR